MKKGFTIIEIAMALAIVGIIFILVLKGRSVFENAKIDADVAKVSKMTHAISGYTAKYGDIPGMMIDETFSTYKLYRDLLGEGLIDSKDYLFKSEDLYLSVIGCRKVEGSLTFENADQTSKHSNLCIVFTETPPTEDVVVRAPSTKIACYIESLHDDSDFTYGVGRASNNVAKDNPAYFSDCENATEPVKDYGYIVF